MGLLWQSLSKIASCRGGRAKWREAKRRSISKRKRKGEGGTQKPSCQKCHDLSNQKNRPFGRCICIWVSPIFHMVILHCHQHVSWRATCSFSGNLVLPSTSLHWKHDVFHRRGIVWIHQGTMLSRGAAHVSYNNKSLCCIMRKMFETGKTLRITLIISGYHWPFASTYPKMVLGALCSMGRDCWWTKFAKHQFNLLLLLMVQNSSTSWYGNIPLFTRFYTSQLVSRISEPSRVSTPDKSDALFVKLVGDAADRQARMGSRQFKSCWTCLFVQLSITLFCAWIN